MMMRTVSFFSDRDCETIALLTRMGLRRSVAAVLVYLAPGLERTARDIEHGADLSQPEVSLAMSYLTGRGWAESRDIKGGGTGRPQKMNRLTKSLPDIVTIIAELKIEETRSQLALITRMKGDARYFSTTPAKNRGRRKRSYD
jgi:predicted transcriptional regulator